MRLMSSGSTNMWRWPAWHLKPLDGQRADHAIFEAFRHSGQNALTVDPGPRLLGESKAWVL